MTGGFMKDSDLFTFKHETIGELRGVMKDGEPWFLAAHTCRCLGIKNANETITRIKERHIRFGDKGVGIAYTPLHTAGGKQTVAIITESVMYELVFRSDKKKAFDFQQWVFGDVLPELRKHGEYRMAGKEIRKTLTDQIKDSSENERMHGHAYSTYTRLVYKSLGITTETSRDAMSAETLESLAVRENLVQALLAEGRTYHEVKAVLEGMTIRASGAC